MLVNRQHIKIRFSHQDIEIVTNTTNLDLYEALKVEYSQTN